MIWLVMANSNNCRIYSFHKIRKEILLIKELNHQQSKYPDRDLVVDRPGRYKLNSTMKGAYAYHTDPKENEIDKFSREIARELNLNRKLNQFQKLILISPPHMIGRIHQHLDDQVINTIINNINKDYQNRTDNEVIKFVIAYQARVSA